MMTQGPASDAKCKLIIPRLSHCTRNAMPIVLLLQMMGGWDGWGMIDLYWGVGGGTGGRYHLVFVLCFCILLLEFLSSFI